MYINFNRLESNYNGTIVKLGYYVPSWEMKKGTF